MKKAIKIFLLCFIIIIGGGYIAYKAYITPTRDEISYSDDLYLVIEDTLLRDKEPVLFQGNTLYFSMEVIKDYIDSDIFYDEAEKTLIITDNEKVNRYKLDEEIATVNNREFLLNRLIKKINNKVYIPRDRLSKHYDININYFKETNAVVIDFNHIKYLEGEIISEESPIRLEANIKSPIVKGNLPQGTLVYIYEEYEKWYKVRTLKGILGFIEKKDIKINYIKDDLFKSEIPKKESEQDLGKKTINLTWDYTYGKVKNTDNIKELPGVNVVSPTWFTVTNKEGAIADRGNTEYVKKYNDLGYEIWPLIDNGFDPDLTHEILSKSSIREKIIKDILETYKTYDVQGINIDFENVHLKTKDYLTQFVRELYPLFKEANMTVSMDITGISSSENWSMFYDRSRLEETVDYMILMAYDQHGGGSQVAGSVAQYSWVENSILGVLKYIPKEKLVLAVPFYTRVWAEEDGKISSRALTMEGINKFIDENNVELQWDEESQQYYGEFKEGKLKHKFWLEDINSLEMKISLMHKYGLAGIASWRKGFETQDIWKKLAKVIY